MLTDEQKTTIWLEEAYRTGNSSERVLVLAEIAGVQLDAVTGASSAGAFLFVAFGRGATAGSSNPYSASSNSGMHPRGSVASGIRLSPKVM